MSDRKIISLQDRYDRLDDATSIAGRSPSGHVEIFERTRSDNIWKLLDKTNTIVYQGREWLLQRALNKARLVGANDPELFISWVGLGTGGATIDDPFNPLDVQRTDTELANPIVINNANTNYADGGRKMPFDNVEFLQDPDNEDKWLIARIYVTLPFEEANGVLLNEAGLYVSTNTDPALATDFRLFSRCTFSTIEKTDQRELLFRWTLYF